MLSGFLASFGIGGAVAAIASAAAILGPSLIAGGPIGLVIAWLGAKAASRSTKAIAILSGLALLIASSVAITIRLEHLEQAAKALAIVKAELAHERLTRAAIERMLACDKRIPAEQELGACLAAQRAEAQKARADELARERSAAAAEQKRLDDEAAAASADEHAADRAIELSPAADDGPVPKVLRDSWLRERQRRGIK